MRPPAASHPRDRYLEQDVVLKLLEAIPEPFRTVAAILHGTGAEVSAVLTLTRPDVDLAAATLRIRGTKTPHRDRRVHVEPGATLILKRHLKRSRFLPDAVVFPGLNRWTVSDKVRDGCQRIGIKDYSIRDARYTYAVRAVRAGAPFEAVARQLGHADPTMVSRVYGRYRPSSDEMGRLHELMAQSDRETRAAG